MKYYDGMGKDVSGYVANLEYRVNQQQIQIEDLQMHLSKAKEELKAKVEVSENSEIVEPLETEIIKPKRKRRKSVKKDADSQ